jgi:hypothetical protein
VGAMVMINDYDLAVLTADLPEGTFQAGNVGIVVHIYALGLGYEIEFISPNSKVIDVITVDAVNVRAVTPHDKLDARSMAGSHVLHVYEQPTVS